MDQMGALAQLSVALDAGDEDELGGAGLAQVEAGLGADPEVVLAVDEDGKNAAGGGEAWWVGCAGGRAVELEFAVAGVAGEAVLAAVPDAAVAVGGHAEDVRLAQGLGCVLGDAEVVGRRVVDDHAGIAGADPEAAVVAGDQRADVVVGQGVGVVGCVGVGADVIAAVAAQAAEGGDPDVAGLVLLDGVDGVVGQAFLAAEILEVHLGHGFEGGAGDRGD